MTLSAVAACSYTSLRGLRVATLNWARMRILLRGCVQRTLRLSLPNWLTHSRTHS